MMTKAVRRNGLVNVGRRKMGLSNKTIQPLAKLTSFVPATSSARGLCPTSLVGVKMGRRRSCARSGDNASRFHGRCGEYTFVSWEID